MTARIIRTVSIAVASVLLFCSFANASTYYISTTGSDSGNGGSDQPWATFAHAWTAMSGGDTLILKCGTYTQQIKPPATLNGSAGAYTTIRAETDWCVTVDGSSGVIASQGTLHLGYVSYFLVRGIKFSSNPSYIGGQSPIVVTNSDHIKLIKLAGYDSPCTNNTAVFSIGPGDSYSLVEDSYAWGCGRYKFLVYQGNHVIVRHSVARHDYHDITGWPGVMSGWGRQCAGFAHYDDYNVLWQNVIAIDSGVADKSTGSYWGGWWAPDGDVVPGHGTNGKDMSGKIQGSIFVNNITGSSGATINDGMFSGTREIVDVALYGNDTGVSMTRDDTTIAASFLGHHLTIVNTTGTHTSSYDARGIGATTANNTNVTQALIQDSIIQQANSFGMGGYFTSDYNLFYGNTADFGSDWYQAPVPTAGTHDVQGTNPQLKYITRVESSTPGKGTASDGGDRGATILYRMGTPGTLYGETGYDTLTSTPLWPWDDEAVIKSDMASFSMVNPVAGGTISGARGFAASGTGLYGGDITLTSYIWEQLGNPCPPEICSGGTTPTTTGASIGGGAAIGGGVIVQ